MQFVVKSWDKENFYRSHLLHSIADDFILQYPYLRVFSELCYWSTIYFVTTARVGTRHCKDIPMESAMAYISLLSVGSISNGHGETLLSRQQVHGEPRKDGLQTPLSIGSSMTYLVKMDYRLFWVEGVAWHSVAYFHFHYYPVPFIFVIFYISFPQCFIQSIFYQFSQFLSS